MKKDFSERPEKFTEPWCTWQGFLTAMPSLVFVVTGWKSNGKENACLQSWASFAGGGQDEFVCILGAVSKGGHMYRSLKETGVCVLNFPSFDIYERCVKTIGNNEFETDEISAAGLTAERAVKVNAPRIKECFLNIECEYLWEHELFENAGFFGNQDVTVALKAVNICMDGAHYDQSKLGRYGQTGYLYQIDQPTNPETGEKTQILSGTLEPSIPIPWNKNRVMEWNSGSLFFRPSLPERHSRIGGHFPRRAFRFISSPQRILPLSWDLRFASSRWRTGMQMSICRLLSK